MDFLMKAGTIIYIGRKQIKILARINLLIKDTQRDPFKGLGEPEPLKHELQGFWSRRINREHRLIYQFEKGELHIMQCRYHY